MDPVTIFVVLLVIGFFILKIAGKVGRGIMHELGRQVSRMITAWLIYICWTKWFGKERKHQPREALPCDEMYAACPMSAFEGDPSKCRWCNGDLPERAKKFCRPQCRITARNNHEFSLAKDVVLARDGFQCVTCGGEATAERGLEVNHKTPCLGRHDVPGCWHHVDGLETLCWRCHLKVTNRQRRTGQFRRGGLAS